MGDGSKPPAQASSAEARRVHGKSLVFLQGAPHGWHTRVMPHRHAPPRARRSFEKARKRLAIAGILPFLNRSTPQPLSHILHGSLEIRTRAQLHAEDAFCPQLFPRILIAAPAAGRYGRQRERCCDIGRHHFAAVVCSSSTLACGRKHTL
jgi:hypothetical protein